MDKGRVSAFAAALVLAAANSAAAEDWPDHDWRIEHWAAQKVSARLGDLRAGFGAGAQVRQVTVHDAFSRSRQEQELPSPIFALPPRGENLPPIVMNEAVPPGVDPIITGSNRNPTRAASRVARPRVAPIR